MTAVAGRPSATLLFDWKAAVLWIVAEFSAPCTQLFAQLDRNKEVVLTHRELTARPPWLRRVPALARVSAADPMH